MLQSERLMYYKFVIQKSVLGWGGVQARPGLQQSASLFLLLFRVHDSLSRYCTDLRHADGGTRSTQTAPDNLTKMSHRLAHCAWRSDFSYSGFSEHDVVEHRLGEQH